MRELADRLPPGLGRLVRTLVAIKLVFSAIALLILPVTFFCVVIFRYVLERDLFAYEEWLLPVSFWLYFMGSAVGSYQNKQIRADILESYFSSARAEWIRRVVLSVIETLIACVVVYWAYLMIAREIGMYPNWQKTIALKIPFFVSRLGIFLGFVFMTFYGLLHLYVLLRFGVEVVEDERALENGGAT
ncbi:MAG: TRAP transporter small permease subunit [Rhizobiales bacterium]|nr:TRAP transporter small permease subunit [Hyphomicrobiales bacterium]